MDIDQLRTIGRVFFYGVCVIAALRGDRPLKYTGAIIMMQALIGPFLQRRYAWELPQYGILFSNTVVLGVMVALLLRDRRWWLVWACGCWLMCTLTHVAYLIGSPISPYVRATVGLLWAYATVVCIGCGLVAHELRRRRLGRGSQAVRAMIAEYGQARTQAELDRRHLVATDPSEKAEAARLVEALRRLTSTSPRDKVS